jgi:hypothetical protein
MRFPKLGFAAPLIAAAAALCLPGGAHAQAAFVHYHASQTMSVPVEFLQYARKNGYKYVIMQGELATVTGTAEWTNGVYNYNGSLMLYNALFNEFKKAGQQKMRLVPYFTTGSRNSSAWKAVNNPNIQWNELTGNIGNNPANPPFTWTSPVYARQFNGLDRSYASLLGVIKRAFNAAMAALPPADRYPLEYIHIGFDETFVDVYNPVLGQYEPWILAGRPGSGTNADQDSLKSFAKPTREGSFDRAYRKLFAGAIARRVQAVKDTFPTTSPPIKVLMWGDMADPNHSGATPMKAWALDAAGNQTTIEYRPGDTFLHPDLNPYKDRLVIMPWYNLTGTAEQTFDHLFGLGFYFGSAHAFDPTHVWSPPGKLQSDMWDFIRAGSLIKYGSKRVGYSANNWTDGGMYWGGTSTNTDTRPPNHLIIPAMAKAARFFKDTTDFVRLVSNTATNPPSLRIDKFRAAPTLTTDKFVRTAGSTDLGGFANLGFLVGNVRGSLKGDVREDFIKLWDNGGNLRADIYRSNGSLFTRTAGTADLGPSTNRLATLAGDFNGDGATDIINLINNGGRIRWVCSRSTGSAFETVLDIPDYGGSTGQFFTADWNRDGFTDVLQLWDNGGRLGLEVYESRYDANSNFTSFVLAWASPDMGGFTGQFYTGDVNGDGRTDIYHLWDNGGRLAVDVYQATAGGYAHPANNANVGGFTGQFFTGDYNGDGKTDIYQAWDNAGVQHIEVYSPDDNQRFFLQKGTGNLGTSNVQQYLVRDWNADGRTDLVKLIKNSSNKLEIQVLQATGASAGSSSAGFTMPYNSSGQDKGTFGGPYLALDFTGNN